MKHWREGRIASEYGDDNSPKLFYAEKINPVTKTKYYEFTVAEKLPGSDQRMFVKCFTNDYVIKTLVSCGYGKGDTIMLLAEQKFEVKVNSQGYKENVLKNMQVHEIRLGPKAKASRPADQGYNQQQNPMQPQMPLQQNPVQNQMPGQMPYQQNPMQGQPQYPVQQPMQGQIPVQQPANIQSFADIRAEQQNAMPPGQTVMSDEDQFDD